MSRPEGKVHDLPVFADHHQFCMSAAVRTHDGRRFRPEQRVAGWSEQRSDHIGSRRHRT